MGAIPNRSAIHCLDSIQFNNISLEVLPKDRSLFVFLLISLPIEIRDLKICVILYLKYYINFNIFYFIHIILKYSYIYIVFFTMF